MARMKKALISIAILVSGYSFGQKVNDKDNLNKDSLLNPHDKSPIQSPGSNFQNGYEAPADKKTNLQKDYRKDESLNPAIVKVVMSGTTSSGTLVKLPDGKIYVLTVAHAIDEKASSIVLLVRKEKSWLGSDLLAHNFKTIKKSKKNGARLVQIQNPTEREIQVAVPFTPKSKTKIKMGKHGEQLQLIGCRNWEFDIDSTILPLRRFGIPTEGISLERENGKFYGRVVKVRTKPPFDSGDSGGPVFNMNGELVGVITVSDEGRGAYFSTLDFRE